MRLGQKILAIQLLCHLISIPAILYAITTDQMYLLLISFFSYVVLLIIVGNITLHRLLSHRSFKTYLWIENFLSYFSVIGTLGPPISWVAIHRIHHTLSDTDKDPHLFYTDKKFNLKKAIKIWFLYDFKVTEFSGKYVKDLLKNPNQKFIYENYFKILVSFWIIIILVNPIFLIYVYALPLSCALHSLGFLNVFGHWHGYKTYNTKDFSTNSWIANIFTFGEGWHNNHHYRPSNWKTGEQWWEIDITSWVIRLIKVGDN